MRGHGTAGEHELPRGRRHSAEHPASHGEIRPLGGQVQALLHFRALWRGGHGVPRDVRRLRLAPRRQGRRHRAPRHGAAGRPPRVLSRTAADDPRAADRAVGKELGAPARRTRQAAQEGSAGEDRNDADSPRRAPGRLWLHCILHQRLHRPWGTGCECGDLDDDHAPGGWEGGGEAQACREREGNGGSLGPRWACAGSPHAG
mmetsp:Transcript_46263/g.148094  ORF Transcript_46263/g.148094 Transcript_46263/m.148094 type:complete len:202 (-) Transcript_46263:315-920(-)